MVDQIFSWSTLLTLVGLTGFYLAGKKVWWCWYINIACQGLWFAYALSTDQYGFILGAIFYTFIFSKNAAAWTKEHRLESVPPPKVIGHVEKLIEDDAGLSVQFKFNNEDFGDGIRRIREASITGISIFDPTPKKRKWWKKW